MPGWKNQEVEQVVKSDNLDELDKKIVIALSENGRRPYREIARQTGVSESLIRKRVNRLSEEGLARITLVGNLIELGFEAVAMILLKVPPNRVEEYADRIAQYPFVRFVAISLGTADIMFQSLHTDLPELHSFVRNELPCSLPDIVSVEVLPQVKTVKSASLDAWFELPNARGHLETDENGKDKHLAGAR